MASWRTSSPRKGEPGLDFRRDRRRRHRPASGGRRLHEGRGRQISEVPYKGSPPAFTDLLAGRIDLFFDSNRAGCLMCSRAGEGHRGAVVEAQPAGADVPTMSEAGVPASMSIPGSGYSRPPKPAGDNRKLRRDIRASLPELKERFEKSGGEVWDLPDDKLDASVASEYDDWTKLIREAGIKLD
jgi:tripartite-type tricarboxylate transporter receptor subunit TctC